MSNDSESTPMEHPFAVASTESESASVVTATASNANEKIPTGEIIIGTLVGVSAEGKPLVKCEELFGDENRPAITTVNVETRFFGRQVALMFVNGESNSPIIVGFIRSQLIEMLDAFEFAEEDQTEAESDDDTHQQEHSHPVTTELEVDGRKILLEAKDELCLKCGESSITLTKAGKISIRGKYILNRSTGVNRVLGGSVEIN